MARHRFRVAAEHPCLPGHFPGRPVVPGVVLLDAVFALLEVGGTRALAGIEAVKFLAPVLPGQEVEIAFDRRADRVAFSAVTGGRVVMRGAVRLAGGEPRP
ncbi:MAG: beta-hydroxyacyl-ACP dehydratase [Acidisphaera sp.]|nr:beta-hydroxyacyl-ACP dehydratase [Acidisphaera sp.]